VKIGLPSDIQEQNYMQILKRLVFCCSLCFLTSDVTVHQQGSLVLASFGVAQIPLFFF